jgi:hypothetical protein
VRLTLFGRRRRVTFVCPARAEAPGRYTTSLRVGRPVEVVGLIRSIKLKLFAALLLRAMAQEQARTESERISPRHPEVARRLSLEPDSPELGIAERYLAREDYIRPSGVEREAGPITPPASRLRNGSPVFLPSHSFSRSVRSPLRRSSLYSPQAAPVPCATLLLHEGVFESRA